MRRKNTRQLFENVEVIDAGAKGKTIGKAPDGRVIFLTNTVPGDVVDANSTSFALTRQINDSNVDTLVVSYEIQEVFVSRACGYIVNYDALEATIIQDDSVWIQETIITTSLIENTASAHVKILH